MQCNVGARQTACVAVLLIAGIASVCCAPRSDAWVENAIVLPPKLAKAEQVDKDDEEAHSTVNEVNSRGGNKGDKAAKGKSAKVSGIKGKSIFAYAKEIMEAGKKSRVRRTRRCALVPTIHVAAKADVTKGLNVEYKSKTLALSRVRADMNTSV